MRRYVEECLVCHKRLKKDQECTHTSRRKLRKGESKEFAWINGVSVRRWER